MNSTDWEVRRASIRALGEIGPAAGSSCPHLRALTAYNPFHQVPMTKAEMEYAVRFEDLLRATRKAIAKIGCD